MFKCILCTLLFIALIFSGSQQLYTSDREIAIKIISEEQILLNDEYVDIDELTEKLKSLKEDGRKAVVIQVAGDVTMGFVYDVQKSIVESGLTRVEHKKLKEE